jgi:hypothetical protein
LKRNELLSPFAFTLNLRRCILADFCYYYMISWAEGGGGGVRLPSGIV